MSERIAAGVGCPLLYRDDPDRGALLMERLGPSLFRLGLPYEQRRALLAQVLEPGPGWAVPAHRVGDGAAHARIVERRAKSGIFLTSGSASVDAMALFAKAGLPLDPIQIYETVELRKIHEITAVRLACERADLGPVRAQPACRRGHGRRHFGRAWANRG